VNTDLMKREILNLRDKGATIIFSTHNMETVEDLCENISLVDNAKVVLQGNVAEIRESHATKTYVIRSSSPVLGNEMFQLLSQTDKNGVVESIIKKQTTEGNNVLINELMIQTNILSFEELLPSMNDIFIETVRKYRYV
jgi:ABC-2 type transport system ATP-binding protein